MPLQVVDSTGYASYSNIASAITYAADHGARIVNVSIGGTSPSSTLQNAVNYAWNKGTVVFAAAGNGGSSTPYYPAACQNVVSVGATDGSDLLASWSSYGTWMTMVAPGVSIYTTTNGGGYNYVSGSSYSSPIAAGVGALVLSYAPSLSAAALVSTLENNSDDLGAPGFDPTFGWGRVNAYRAVSGVGISTDTIPPTVSISNPLSSTSVQGTINIQGTATDNVGVTRIEFYVDGNLVSTAFTSPFSFSWNTTTAANGTHTIVVKAYDAANNVGQSSRSVNVSNPVVVTAQGLAVSIVSPTNGTSVTGHSLTVSAATLDSVRVTQVAVYVDGVLQYVGTVAPYSFNLNTKKMSIGNHTVFAKAWDILGLVSTSSTVTFSVR
jgi:hypothetical protein